VLGSEVASWGPVAWGMELPVADRERRRAGDLYGLLLVNAIDTSGPGTTLLSDLLRFLI
jgi:hypothetical protein